MSENRDILGEVGASFYSQPTPNFTTINALKKAAQKSRENAELNTVQTPYNSQKCAAQCARETANLANEASNLPQTPYNTQKPSEIEPNSNLAQDGLPRGKAASNDDAGAEILDKNQNENPAQTSPQNQNEPNAQNEPKPTPTPTLTPPPPTPTNPNQTRARAITARLPTIAAKLAAAAILALITLALALASDKSFFNPEIKLGVDSSVFTYIGYAISRGLAPYAQAFDHKGLLLYLYNAWGYALAGELRGGWIFEVGTLAVAVALAYKTARLWLSRAVAVGAVALVFDAYFPLVVGGNLTEQYALGYLFAGLYVFARMFGASAKELRAAAFGAGGRGRGGDGGDCAGGRGRGGGGGDCAGGAGKFEFNAASTSKFALLRRFCAAAGGVLRRVCPTRLAWWAWVSGGCCGAVFLLRQNMISLWAVFCVAIFVGEIFSPASAQNRIFDINPWRKRAGNSGENSARNFVNSSENLGKNPTNSGTNSAKNPAQKQTFFRRLYAKFEFSINFAFAFALVFGAACGYLALKDALWAFFDDYFAYNFIYIQQENIGDHHTQSEVFWAQLGAPRMVFCLCAMVAGAAILRSKFLLVGAAFGLFSVWAATVSGVPYEHYFMVFLPIYLVGFLAVARVAWRAAGAVVKLCEKIVAKRGANLAQKRAKFEFATAPTKVPAKIPALFAAHPRVAWWLKAACGVAIGAVALGSTSFAVRLPAAVQTLAQREFLPPLTPTWDLRPTIEVLQKTLREDEKFLAFGNDAQWYLWTGRLASSRYFYQLPIADVDSRANWGRRDAMHFTRVIVVHPIWVIYGKLAAWKRELAEMGFVDVGQGVYVRKE